LAHEDVTLLDTPLWLRLNTRPLNLPAQGFPDGHEANVFVI